jgi:hypothetical protein
VLVLLVLLLEVQLGKLMVVGSGIDLLFDTGSKKGIFGALRIGSGTSFDIDIFRFVNVS